MQNATLRGQPPSLFFGIKPNRKTLVYTKLDVLLAEALRMYEDALCPGCHEPTMWVWDIRNSTFFELDADAPICITCELLEHAATDPEAKPEPGEKRRLVNRMPQIRGGVDG